MAHLEVEPKPTRPWWVWMLIVLLVILLAALLWNKCEPDYSVSTSAKLFAGYPYNALLT